MMVDNVIVKIWASDIKHMLNSLVNLRHEVMERKSWGVYRFHTL